MLRSILDGGQFVQYFLSDFVCSPQWATLPQHHCGDSSCSPELVLRLSSSLFTLLDNVARIIVVSDCRFKYILRSFCFQTPRDQRSLHRHSIERRVILWLPCVLFPTRPRPARSYECRIGVEAWLQLVKARFCPGHCKGSVVWGGEGFLCSIICRMRNQQGNPGNAPWVFFWIFDIFLCQSIFIPGNVHVLCF